MCVREGEREGGRGRKREGEGGRGRERIRKRLEKERR